MAQGIQLWDASGTLKFDITTRIGKVLGSSVVTSSGSSSVPKFADGTGFVFAPATSATDAFPNNFDHGTEGYASISGTTLTWTITGGVERTLVWGVF